MRSDPSMARAAKDAAQVLLFNVRIGDEAETAAKAARVAPGNDLQKRHPVIIREVNDAAPVLTLKARLPLWVKL